MIIDKDIGTYLIISIEYDFEILSIAYFHIPLGRSTT
jgi:hypothetical protein